jgi:2,3-bisphosphoglycerate-dependent phosphoglycerate mutase
VQLYLIRHAESENNARPEHQRVEDPAITPRGEQQADCLASWLTTQPIDRIVVSPFRRALQTAIPATRHSDIPIEVWCDIYERGGCYRGWKADDFQGAEGLGHDGIRQLIPAAILDPQLAVSGWWGSKPRELDHETEQRATAVRLRIEQQFGDTGQSVALITHAEFQRLLLGQLLSGSAIGSQDLGPICNAGVTYLQWNRSRWQIHWFNSVTHMPGSMITGAKG